MLLSASLRSPGVRTRTARRPGRGRAAPRSRGPPPWTNQRWALGLRDQTPPITAHLGHGVGDREPAAAQEAVLHGLDVGYGRGLRHPEPLLELGHAGRTLLEEVPDENNITIFWISIITLGAGGIFIWAHPKSSESDESE